jgi:hypothetical protein
MKRSMSLNLSPLLKGTAQRRGLFFGVIISLALLAFEIFNFSSTQFALQDILGTLTFGPFEWATILALAFCGIDFAGIARIFTPEKGRDEPAEVWYLFGAWFLAAAFNAILTWWGVSVAMLSHSAQGSAVLGAPMMKFVPIFVAGMVLLIRVLLINTFSIAGENLFSVGDDKYSSSYRPSYRQANETYSAPMNSSLPRPAPKPTPAASTRPLYTEPTYHPVGMNAQERVENPSVRR